MQSSVHPKHFKLPSKNTQQAQAGGRVIGETRAQILADKRHGQRVKAARKTAAIRTIASSKVSYLPDDAGEDDRQSPLPSPSSSRGGIGGGKIKSKKPSETDLGSGSAALDIANAFLTGSLGRQLLLDPGEEGTFRPPQEEEKEEKEKERGNQSVSYKFDISDKEEQAGENDNQRKQRAGQEQAEEKEEKGDDGHTARYAQYTGRDKYESCAPLYDNKGQRFASSRGKEQKEGGSEYYAENWRSTQGGWVADFGAPHTHTLSGKDDDSSYGFGDE
jgi:hypothetical protein